MSQLPTLPDTTPILHELALIVGPNANDSEPDVLDLFVRSKHLMRQVNNVVKAHKDATIHARAEMDAVLLVLQNLLYEKRHVEREITRCQEFGYVVVGTHIYFISFHFYFVGVLGEAFMRASRASEIPTSSVTRITDTDTDTDMRGVVWRGVAWRKKGQYTKIFPYTLWTSSSNSHHRKCVPRR